MAEEAGSHRRTLHSAPYVSSLRVYEPLDAFDEDVQLAILAQRARSREETERLDREATLQRITRTVSDPYPHGGHDLIRVLHYPSADGIRVPYYCPNQLMARCVLAAESVASTIRGPLLDVLLPDAAVNAQQERLDPDVFADQVAALHTRSAVWGIPFSWFVLVREHDHADVVDEDDHLSTVLLSVPLLQCLDRIRFAAASLAIAAPEMDLLEELTDLGEWLESFHRDSIVELDYGAVANFVFPDDSPSDVREGIECLVERDFTGAAAAYRRLANRWIPIRQLGRAS